MIELRKASILLFSIITGLFLFRKIPLLGTKLFPFYIHAFLIYLTLLRALFIGQSSFNFRPLTISLLIWLIFLFTHKKDIILNILKSIDPLGIGFTQFLIMAFGVTSICFFTYDSFIKKYKSNYVYRLIELCFGIFFILYNFIYTKAFIILKICLIISILSYPAHYFINIVITKKTNEKLINRLEMIKKYLSPY